MERNKKKIQIDISGEKCQQHKVLSRCIVENGKKNGLKCQEFSDEDFKSEEEPVLLGFQVLQHGFIAVEGGGSGRARHQAAAAVDAA